MSNTRNRDEINISFMESMSSYFAPITKETLQEDENFINRQRDNENSRELHGAKLFN